MIAVLMDAGIGWVVALGRSWALPGGLRRRFRPSQRLRPGDPNFGLGTFDRYRRDWSPKITLPDGGCSTSLSGHGWLW
jgi:hypothetical protein